MYMLDSRAVDIHHEGKLEVSHIGPELHLDSVWIVDTPSNDPSNWKVLHKEPLKEGKRVGSPMSVKSDNTAPKEAVKASETVKAAPVPVVEQKVNANATGKAESTKKSSEYEFQ